MSITRRKSHGKTKFNGRKQERGRKEAEAQMAIYSVAHFVVAAYPTSPSQGLRKSASLSVPIKCILTCFKAGRYRQRKTGKQQQSITA